ncbi:hypothetical protein D3C84_998510 [compost metagenome]
MNASPADFVHPARTIQPNVRLIRINEPINLNRTLQLQAVRFHKFACGKLAYNVDPCRAHAAFYR